MKVIKRLLIIVVIVAVIVGGLYFYNRYNSVQNAQAAFSSIDMAALQKGELTVTIAATGKVRPQQTATLSWGTSGQVDQVKVNVGDAVQAGQELATLSQTSLPQSVINAQAALVTDQQALEDLKTTAEQNRVKALSDIVTYENNVKDAQYNLDNFTVPVEQAGLSTTDALTKAKQALDAARKAFEPYRYQSENNSTRKTLLENLNAAQASYNSAVKRLQLEYNLQVAQSSLDQAWATFNKYKDGPDPKEVTAAQAKIAADQAALALVSVKAPFAGTITEVNAQPGDQVSSGTAAFRIDNLSGLYVDLSVSEVDIHQVQASQPVTITFDALRNKSYKGTVSNVSQVSADTSSSSSSGSSSSAVNFTVTVKVTDPDQAVRPGMTSEVQIITGQKQNVVLVPLQAVTTVNGRQVVYVYQPGAASGTPVPGQPGGGNFQRPAGTPPAGQAGGFPRPSGTAQARSGGFQRNGGGQFAALAAQGFRPVPITLGLTNDSYGELVTGNLQPGEQIVLNPDRLLGTIQSNSFGQRGGIFGGLFGGGIRVGGANRTGGNQNTNRQQQNSNQVPEGGPPPGAFPGGVRP